MKVNHGLFPWDLGLGHNEEWLHLIPVLDSIEHEFTEWKKEKDKKEEIDNSNAIPRSEKKEKKKSIKDRILGTLDEEEEAAKEKKKKKKERTANDEADKSIEIPVPWRNAKEKAKSIRELLRI